MRPKRVEATSGYGRAVPEGSGQRPGRLTASHTLPVAALTARGSGIVEVPCDSSDRLREWLADARTRRVSRVLGRHDLVDPREKARNVDGLRQNAESLREVGHAGRPRHDDGAGRVDLGVVDQVVEIAVGQGVVCDDDRVAARIQQGLGSPNRGSGVDVEALGLKELLHGVALCPAVFDAQQPACCSPPSARVVTVRWSGRVLCHGPFKRENHIRMTESNRAFDEAVQASLKNRAEAIARQWLEQLQARLEEQRRDVFPGDTLLNHIPAIIQRLSSATVGDLRSVDSAFVREDLTRLAQLRRSQGFELSEVLLEFDLLRSVVLEVVFETASDYAGPLTPAQAIRVALRLERALSILAEVTSETYLREFGTVTDQLGELLKGFGSNLLHEVRNRLNSVSLNLEILRSVPIDDKERGRVLGRIDDAIGRLATATSDVFLVAIGATRTATVRAQRLDDAIKDVVADASELARSHGVSIRVAPELPSVVVDGARVQLALLNLVTNAIKYRDGAKPEAFVELRVSRTETEREWQIDVVDNGVGIPKELQPKVFKPHMRAAADDSVEGEGLGLALAHSAVTQLQGRIWVESRRGEGTVFSFTFREASRDLPPLSEEEETASGS